VHNTMQRPKKRVQGDVAKLLDGKARDASWYMLAFDTDSSRAILENHARKLPSGAFVVTTSALNFATLCVLHKGSLLNVPIDADERGLALRVPGGGKAAASPHFDNLSELVAHYSAKSQRELPVRLQPDALEQEDIEKAFDTTETVKRPSHINPVYQTGAATAPMESTAGTGDRPSHVNPAYQSDPAALPTSPSSRSNAEYTTVLVGAKAGGGIWFNAVDTSSRHLTQAGSWHLLPSLVTRSFAHRGRAC